MKFTVHTHQVRILSAPVYKQTKKKDDYVSFRVRSKDSGIFYLSAFDSMAQKVLNMKLEEGMLIEAVCEMQKYENYLSVEDKKVPYMDVSLVIKDIDYVGEKPKGSSSNPTTQNHPPVRGDIGSFDSFNNSQGGDFS